MKVFVKQDGLLVPDKELSNNFGGSKGEIIVRCKKTGLELFRTLGTLDDAREIAKRTYECLNCQSSDCGEVIYRFIG